MKHTPAPWHQNRQECGEPIVSEGYENGIGIRICDMDCVDFYDIVSNDGDLEVYELQKQANARLIAAAPDMLQSIEALLAMFKQPEPTESDWDAAIPEPVKQARALIQKIKGE